MNDKIIHFPDQLSVPQDRFDYEVQFLNLYIIMACLFNSGDNNTKEEIWEDNVQRLRSLDQEIRASEIPEDQYLEGQNTARRNLKPDQDLRRGDGELAKLVRNVSSLMKTKYYIKPIEEAGGCYGGQKWRNFLTSRNINNCVGQLDFKYPEVSDEDWTKLISFLKGFNIDSVEELSDSCRHDSDNPCNLIRLYLNLFEKMRDIFKNASKNAINLIDECENIRSKGLIKAICFNEIPVIDRWDYLVLLLQLSDDEIHNQCISGDEFGIYNQLYSPYCLNEGLFGELDKGVFIVIPTPFGGIIEPRRKHGVMAGSNYNFSNSMEVKYHVVCQNIEVADKKLNVGCKNISKIYNGTSDIFQLVDHIPKRFKRKKIRSLSQHFEDAKVKILGVCPGNELRLEADTDMPNYYPTVTLNGAHISDQYELVRRETGAVLEFCRERKIDFLIFPEMVVTEPILGIIQESLNSSEFSTEYCDGVYPWLVIAGSCHTEVKGERFNEAKVLNCCGEPIMAHKKIFAVENSADGILENITDGTRFDALDIYGLGRLGIMICKDYLSIVGRNSEFVSPTLFLIPSCSPKLKHFHENADTNYRTYCSSSVIINALQCSNNLLNFETCEQCSKCERCPDQKECNKGEVAPPTTKCKKLVVRSNLSKTGEAPAVSRLRQGNQKLWRNYFLIDTKNGSH